MWYNHTSYEILFTDKKKWNTDMCHTWMNLKNIIQSERSQLQKTTYGTIPFVSAQNKEIHRARK